MAAAAVATGVAVTTLKGALYRERKRLIGPDRLAAARTMLANGKTVPDIAAVLDVPRDALQAALVVKSRTKRASGCAAE